MIGHAIALPLLQVEHCAWFLDVDGTLLDLALTPAEVRVPRALRELLVDLHRAAAGAVALISGRSIADVDAVFQLDQTIAVAGIHGLERRGARGRISRARTDPVLIDAAREMLRPTITRFPALLLEDKGSALALHYRRAPELETVARRAATNAAQTLRGGLRVQEGKCVVELRPAGHDKGSAVTSFMHETPFAGRTPVMIGDDATDEDAFLAVNRMHGMSIKVGDGDTRANLRAESPAVVRDWLRALVSR